MVEKRWNILQADEQKARALQASLGIGEVLCRILVQRGIGTSAEAGAFFGPGTDGLHDAWLMKDMEKAVARILRARGGEKVLVYGDYDVDGTTAVACVYDFLSRWFPPDTVDFYIPHRYREGYGISHQGIDYARTNGFTLIISLDCGIKSAGLIAFAATLGIDFIVCDHHLPDTDIPPAVAILNPKQQGCPYPYKELCGCGIGFKLIAALCSRLGLEEKEALRYLDLVATAIAGDMVPLDGENRVISYFGLKKANEDPNHGIKALAMLGGSFKELRMNSLVYVIAPRVNAAGRMDDARKVVHLFTATNAEDALTYAKQLHADNTDRKIKDLHMTEEALALLENQEGHIDRRSTVLYQPHWHKGVVGIVASRLIDRYYRPTVVLAQSGEIIAGSARSVNGFNVYEALHACKDLLLGYGGHSAAAGITLLPEQVDAFTHKFEATVAATIQPGSLTPELTIDAELSLEAIQPWFYRMLAQMQPFGPGNTQPIFVARGLTDLGSSVVKDQHIRFYLRQGDIQADGIGFGLAGKFHLLQTGAPVDLVFTVEENEWNNQKNLQLKVIDLKLSS